MSKRKPIIKDLFTPPIALKFGTVTNLLGIGDEGSYPAP